MNNYVCTLTESKEKEKVNCAQTKELKKKKKPGSDCVYPQYHQCYFQLTSYSFFKAGAPSSRCFVSPSHVDNIVVSYPSPSFIYHLSPSPCSNSLILTLGILRQTDTLCWPHQTHGIINMLHYPKHCQCLRSWCQVYKLTHNASLCGLCNFVLLLYVSSII